MLLKDSNITFYIKKYSHKKKCCSGAFTIKKCLLSQKSTKRESVILQMNKGSGTTQESTTKQ